MRKKMIPLSKGAELAGKLHRNGAPNPRALKQWIRRWNAKNPSAPIFSGYNVVDEVSLLAAIHSDVEARTPGIAVTRAVESHNTARTRRGVDRTHRIHTSNGRALH